MGEFDRGRKFSFMKVGGVSPFTPKVFVCLLAISVGLVFGCKTSGGLQRADLSDSS